jgi:hypothetical protein
VEGQYVKIVGKGTSLVILQSSWVNCNALMDIISICRSPNSLVKNCWRPFWFWVWVLSKESQ